MNIAQNPTLRKLITARWKELSMKPASIMQDAMEREPNMHFSPSTYSRWVGNKKGGFTDSQMIWLATRWGIDINLNFGSPYLNEKGGLSWKVLPYSELECLQNIAKLSKVANVKKKPAKKSVKKK